MQKLILAYDGKRAVRNNTGLGNYSRLVIDVLSTRYPDNEYRLYSPVTEDNPRLKPLLLRPKVHICEPDNVAGKLLPSLWRVRGGLTNQLVTDKVNLYHGLSNELPLDIKRINIPSVVTIHDLIFRRMPECYAPIDRKIYDYKFHKACDNATRVIAISRRTRDDIVEFYGTDPSKIDIVYQGCDSMFHHPVIEDERRKLRQLYKLPERYIIAVGTVERRKNLMLSVSALRGLPADVKLIVVGRREHSYARELDAAIRHHRLADRIMWLNGIPFNHLPGLYAMSLFAAYTSRYEGFGIPVIEAISTGVPVIAATGSCLEEAGGPGAVYTNPDDVDQYIDYARALLDSPELRSSMVDAGRKHIKQFTSQHFADGLAASYLHALQQY